MKWAYAGVIHISRGHIGRRANNHQQVPYAKIVPESYNYDIGNAYLHSTLVASTLPLWPPLVAELRRPLSIYARFAGSSHSPSLDELSLSIVLGHLLSILGFLCDNYRPD